MLGSIAILKISIIIISYFVKNQINEIEDDKLFLTKLFNWDDNYVINHNIFYQRILKKKCLNFDNGL